MSKFKGTIKDYHKFIGPRIRNVVQSITKKAKKDAGNICEMCNKELELEAAHIHGKERKQIIEAVLNPFLNDSGIIEINLEEIEKEIKERHYPLNETFKFLCKSCHKEYDDNNHFQNKNQEKSNYKQSKTQNMKVGKFIRTEMEKLFKENKLSDKMITNLLKVNYSKRIFNTGSNQIAMLKEIIFDNNSNKSKKEQLKEQITITNVIRYYEQCIDYKGKKYAICSQWYDDNRNQREHFIKWLDSIKKEKIEKPNNSNENLRQEFFNWMIIVRGLKENTAQARLNNFLRICEHEGDIDVLYEEDQCINLLERLTYGVEDQRNNNPVQHNVPINGNIQNGMATLKSAVQLYIDFRNETN